MKKEISVAEIKQLQLSMMDELDAFCRENGLQYYLLGGSALGAVRHQGMIPWDDDIDIGLPREDYDRLLETFQSPSGDVELWSHKNHKGYYYAYAKAIHNKTELEETDPKHKIGVYVDVFPLDWAPADRKEQERLVKKSQWCQSLLGLKHFRCRLIRNKLKKLIFPFVWLPLQCIPDKLLISGVQNGGEKHRNSGYIGNFCGIYGMKEIVPQAFFGTGQELPFEGRLYRVPADHDGYLTALYGDYMTPPPEEKRVTHHLFTAVWKHGEQKGK